jgi:hypothetical protein
MVRQKLDQAEGKPDRLLLYIDQWEELYAQGSSSSEPVTSSPYLRLMHEHWLFEPPC